MAERTGQKRQAVGFTTASGQTPKAFEVSHVTTLERPDLLILLGLAVVTFGIYAQVIGHRFITIDDLSYVEENPMVNRGVTLAGLAWAGALGEGPGDDPDFDLAHYFDLAHLTSGRRSLGTMVNAKGAASALAWGIVPGVRSSVKNKR